jgi:hypothetical protein
MTMRITVGYNGKLRGAIVCIPSGDGYRAILPGSLDASAKFLAETVPSTLVIAMALVLLCQGWHAAGGLGSIADVVVHGDGRFPPSALPALSGSTVGGLDWQSGGVPQAAHWVGLPVVLWRSVG